MKEYNYTHEHGTRCDCGGEILARVSGDGTECDFLCLNCGQVRQGIEELRDMETEQLKQSAREAA